MSNPLSSFIANIFMSNFENLSKQCLQNFPNFGMVTTHDMFNGRLILSIFLSVQTHSILLPQFSSKRQFYVTFSIKPQEFHYVHRLYFI